jgi:hypothetical protein
MEYQISIFDKEPLTWFQENLKHGSGFENGKVRIYAAALTLNNKQFADYLKEEYGIGGRSIDGGFMDYGSKGIEFRKYKENQSEIHNWTETAKEIKKLISIDDYLTDKEKERIKEIQQNNNGQIPCPIPRYKF